MAESIFANTAIKEAAPYWLEELPYTAMFSTISPNQQPAIFTANNWNHATSPSTLVSLQGIGATRAAAVQLRVLADRRSNTPGSSAPPFLSGVPPALQPLEMGIGATQSLSANLNNTSGTFPVTNLQLNYTIRIWHMTATYKVMAGIPLTSEEHTALSALGIKANFAGAQGDLPADVERIIMGEFQNRRLQTQEILIRPQITTASAQIYQANVPTNELLIIRSIGAEARIDNGCVAEIGRDADPNHLSIRLDNTDLTRRLPMFIPASNNLTISAYASSAPSAPTPIRIVIWRIALSNILRYRLGMIGLAQLQQIYGQKQGEIMHYQLIAGVK